jgi:zinc transporter ZupT
VLALVPLARRQIGDRTVHIMLGFSAGLLLAIALLEVFPEALGLAAETGVDARAPTFAAAAGFLVLLLAHRLLSREGGHFHEEGGRRIQPFATVALGALAVHGIVDGLVIPLGFAAGTSVGTVITLAVVLHQIPDSTAALTVALASGRRGKRAALFVLVTALDTPAGIVLGLLLLNAGPWLVPAGLGFSAGTFLYVSAADLVPELQHRARSTVVLLSILGGFLVVGALDWLFPG